MVYDLKEWPGQREGLALNRTRPATRLATDMVVVESVTRGVTARERVEWDPGECSDGVSSARNGSRLIKTKSVN